MAAVNWLKGSPGLELPPALASRTNRPVTRPSISCQAAKPRAGRPQARSVRPGRAARRAQEITRVRPRANGTIRTVSRVSAP